MRLHRLPISSRAAPNNCCDAARSPAAKKIASPTFAPTAATIPACSASEIFLETGPPSVPSALTKMYAMPFAPRALAQSCQASSSRLGESAPPGMMTAPTYGAWKTLNGVSLKKSVTSMSSYPKRKSGLSDPYLSIATA